MSASTDLALLRLVAPSLGCCLAEAIVSDAGIDRCVTVGFGGSFGSGRTWGRVGCARRGIEVYQQHDHSTALVPWSAVRAVRAAAPVGLLAELAAAVEFYAAGPRYRPDYLPANLCPEHPQCQAMSREDLATARAAVHDAWERDVADPFWRHYRIATTRLQAALAEVLAPTEADEPADLLEMLAAMGASA